MDSGRVDPNVRPSARTDLQDAFQGNAAAKCAAAEVCLRTVVSEMVANRALRAQRIKVAAANPGILDTLTSEGVLVLTNGERSAQFRHHLVFDYVASRVYLDPDG